MLDDPSRRFFIPRRPPGTQPRGEASSHQLPAAPAPVSFEDDQNPPEVNASPPPHIVCSTPYRSPVTLPQIP